MVWEIVPLKIHSRGPLFVISTAKKFFVNSCVPTLSGKYMHCSNHIEIWEGLAQDITSQVELYQSYRLSMGHCNSSRQLHQGYSTAKNENGSRCGWTMDARR